MKIQKVKINGLGCPHFVCEGCGGLIKPDDPRPVVITAVGVRGKDGDDYPVFHSWCDPRTPGHRSLKEWIADAAFNSLGAELSEGDVSRKR